MMIMRVVVDIEPFLSRRAHRVMVARHGYVTSIHTGRSIR